MSIDERSQKSYLGNIWLKYGDKIVLAIGIILIAAVSFEAGYLEGQKNKQESIIVNKAACAPCPKANELAGGSESAGAKTNSVKTEAATGTTEPASAEASAGKQQTCAFVASKNSDKYHLATCQWAARIKPENKICFSSSEEAAKRGYQGAKCCIK
ncbi:MAG: hypothetical protein L0Y73_05175 [Candidatus Aminicenantes bacterium]|nr:hypothetical protein [Candidatus Aminicenantes bacterium]